MNLITISKQTARRFVLGRQGLWPGRRWRGKKGTAQALRLCEAVQLDPLEAVARSQDIVLHSRVIGYQPEYLQRLLYHDRQFFDYGGWLAVYPMSELPYWRHHMQQRSLAKRVEDFSFAHVDIFEQVRQELRTRGPLGNRDVDGNAVVGNYRGRKDSSLALYDMWISGELMIHHRDRFSRVYDFRENVVPPEFDYLAPEVEVEEYFARKCIAFKGLMPETRWKTDLEYYVRRKISSDEISAWRDSWIEQGVVARLQIEGSKGFYLVLRDDLPLLETLEAGRVPRSWKPLEATTLDEVTFLAPLDIVSARGRAQKLF
ncbi:MAG: DNA glycosylase AlkZ-like family protein, partial [Anaerolineales bacterium]